MHIQDTAFTRGKKPLEGLPAAYVENDREACSLELYLEDRLIRVQLVLSYTVYRDFPVVARNARFECLEGCEGIRLEQAMSLSLDLPDSRYTMLDLAGAWGRERYPTSIRFIRDSVGSQHERTQQPSV